MTTNLMGLIQIGFIFLLSGQWGASSANASPLIASDSAGRIYKITVIGCEWSCNDAFEFSDDQGATWRPVSGFDPVNIDFSSVEVDSHDVVYMTAQKIGSGKLTTWKSVDRGQTWSPLHQSGEQVTWSESEHALYMINSSRGELPLILKSVDSGDSWQVVTTLHDKRPWPAPQEYLPLANARSGIRWGTRRIESKPGFIEGIEFLRSQDEGRSWEVMLQQKGVIQAGSFVVTPIGHIYAFNNVFDSILKGYRMRVMASTDEGRSWEVRYELNPSFCGVSIVTFSPEGHFFLGGGTCKALSNGSGWTKSSGWTVVASSDGARSWRLSDEVTSNDELDSFSIISSGGIIALGTNRSESTNLRRVRRWAPREDSWSQVL